MATTYTPIASQILSSTAASITFSSISGSYTDLVLKASTRDTAASIATGAFTLTVNGDTTTKYSQTWLRAVGASPTSSRTTSTTNDPIGGGLMDTAGNTATIFTAVEIYIPNYTLASARPWLTVGASEQNTGTANNLLEQRASLYTGASAITSITIASTTAFAIGSRFDLYGITHL